MDQTTLEYFLESVSHDLNIVTSESLQCQVSGIRFNSFQFLLQVINWFESKEIVEVETLIET